MFSSIQFSANIKTTITNQRRKGQTTETRNTMTLLIFSYGQPLPSHHSLTPTNRFWLLLCFSLLFSTLTRVHKAHTLTQSHSMCDFRWPKIFAVNRQNEITLTTITNLYTTDSFVHLHCLLIDFYRETHHRPTDREKYTENSVSHVSFVSAFNISAKNHRIHLYIYIQI